MSDKARPWPNNAREARDRAAEEIAAAARELEPLINGERQFTETERLRREASALNHAQTALRFLESVGAQTRPY